MSGFVISKSRTLKKNKNGIHTRKSYFIQRLDQNVILLAFRRYAMEQRRKIQFTLQRVGREHYTVISYHESKNIIVNLN